MKNATLFLTECKLTCFGGSEKGTCSCRGASWCKAKKYPGFVDARNKAIIRMSQHVLNMLESDHDNDPNLHTRSS